MKGWFFFLITIPFMLKGEIVWQAADLQKPFALTIQLSGEKIHLDDFLYLDAEFRYPDSYLLNSNALIEQLAWSANPLAPQLQVYQSTLTSLQADKGVMAQKLHAVIRPLVQGPIHLTFLTVSFDPKDKTEASLNVLTPVFMLQVLPFQNQTALPLASLLPLEPEFPLGLTEANRQFLRENPEQSEADQKILQSILKRHTFPWLTLAILVGLGGVGWTAYLMRDHLPKMKRKEVPPPTPKEQAEQAWNELQTRELIDRGMPQEHAIALSTIMLSALEAHSNEKLTHLTTEELAPILEKNPTLSKGQKVSLLVFLSKMDPIKFAGQIPTPAETHEMEQSIHKFIQEI